MLARLFAIAALTLAVPAAARDLTAAERQDLTRAVDDYKRAYQDRAASALAAALPPRVVAEIVGGDTDPETRRQDMAAEIGSQLARDDRFDLQVHPDKVGFGVTADGTEFAVVPIVHTSVRRDKDPIEVRRTVNGQLKTVKLVTEYHTTAWSQVLAIRENGRWYMVNMTDADAVEALYRTYPAFRDVALPRTRSQMQARSVQLE